MANRPSDVRWPPPNVVDFDDIYDALTSIKKAHFPEHTAEDLADPYNQLIALTAALGQHSIGRLNQALKNITLRKAVSRRALISLLEMTNRPLRPIQPSRGRGYAQLLPVPATDTVYVTANTKLNPLGVSDPSYSVDSDIGTGSSLLGQSWKLTAAGVASTITVPATGISLADGDSLVIGFPDLMFDSVSIGLNGDTLTGSQVVSWEYRTEGEHHVDLVTEIGGSLEFDISEFLNSQSATGLEVTIIHRETGLRETVSVIGTSAITSYIGQSSPSTSALDYLIEADWRPIPSVEDTTTGLTVNGTVSFSIKALNDTENLWKKDSVYGWSIRARVTGPTNTIGLTQPINSEGEWYVEVPVSQGALRVVSLGQANGSAFQFLKVPTPPLEEPVYDPKISISVGVEDDWFVVEQFTDSGPTSKHAIFREDPDEGWGLVFGDGTLGKLPDPGSAVVISYRTGSYQPGDLSSGTDLRIQGGTINVGNVIMFRGTSGFQVQEASDLESVRRFRYGIVPQLSMRHDSVVSVPEIEIALSGGAPNRATFTTSDGRKPFSRAFYSPVSTGDRQYRVIVVGPESDPMGSVLSTDTDEAETWLNGEEIGVEIIGGHGPQNTQAIVDSFIPRPLLPTVTLQVKKTTGVRAAADLIIRDFFRPHSRDDNGEFRWTFGSKVPMPVLFGLLWSSIPNRYLVNLTATDGINTFDNGGEVQLNQFELPVLDETYDPTVNIVIIVVS